MLADFRCREDQVKCNGSNVCIYSRNLCDGVEHCTDAEDEHNCSYLHSYLLALDLSSSNLYVSSL